MTRTLTLVALLSGSIAHVALSAEDTGSIDVRTIVDRAFLNLYGFSSVQQVEITSAMRGRETFTRAAQVIRAGAAQGLNKMLVRFTAPPDLRGVGILLLEQDNFQYDAFLYQPILKKVRRVSVYQRHDRFFGTDLAFEDLESKRPNQWQVRWLRNETRQARNCWVIELVPKDFPSGYERIVGWFDQQHPIVLRFEFFRHHEQLKSVDFDSHALVERKGYWIPTQFTFDGPGGSQTRVTLSQIDIRDSFPLGRFTSSSLERGSVKRDAGVAE